MASENSVKKIFDKLYDETPANEIVGLYTKWADQYEQDVVLVEEGYKGFVIIAKIIDLFSFNNNIEILDIAAGTGLVAQELKNLNYFNIDALDPCEAMLNKAKAKGLYRNCFCQFAGEDENDTKYASYDHVVIAGGFSKNHMTYKDINKIIKYSKIDGFISLVFRYEAIRSYQIEVPAEVKRLKNEGIVEIVIETEIPKYYTNVTGYLLVMKRKL